MADLFLVEFGDDEERARRRAEEAGEHARRRQRYAEHLACEAGIDSATAERVIDVLFRPAARGDEPCQCGCHPRLSSMHGDGLDCPCSWSEERRIAQHRNWLDRWHNSEAAEELRRAHEQEEAQIREWLAGQADVVAERTTSMAPEQWHGDVDGHSFYFRERHGNWRIELDLRDTGHFTQRIIDFSDSSEPITEQVALTEGNVIAEGIDTQLGETPVEHIDFIVRTIRDHLWQQRCDHAGSLFYCPKCGERASGPDTHPGE
ncbi:hypothetical protein AB0N05_05905 [Nocardia sp. NPDC051030]|uniref:hypothetical protein n=1 Tax=Nocardia sp. NPDC051030 TaxID=3155162 RepID=UPI00341A5457